jgi:FkbM family methyltransferase
VTSEDLDLDDFIVVEHAGRAVKFHSTTAEGRAIGTFLRRGEFYEAKMLEYIRLLGLGGRYVDVGAAVGTHTLFFALVCDAKHVYSFEPREGVFERLAVNIQINGLQDRVTAYNVGCSDVEGSMTTTLDAEAFTFRTRPLDSMVNKRVDVLKIDVEDMEAKTLDGAARLLRRSHPLVFAEARDFEMYELLVEAMHRHGYQPSGRYFNDTPTFEFVPPRTLSTRRLHRRLAERAAAAYQQTGPHRAPRYGRPIPRPPS